MLGRVGQPEDILGFVSLLYSGVHPGLNSDKLRMGILSVSGWVCRHATTHFKASYNAISELMDGAHRR